ncbi:MAG: type II toxin-antitoxin system VapC family toxin [Puia sp.]|nr:type II toxin-antitoxin system VapC family toxin [Puia sp.]
MQLLLDTHTFIWFISGDQALPQRALSAIKDTDNKCYISIASIWEIALKSSLKKLELKSDFDNIIDFLAENDIEILPINFAHLQRVITLEFHHRDPFDRIIIAQGLVENLTIITKDENFPSYTERLLWK